MGFAEFALRTIREPFFLGPFIKGDIMFVGRSGVVATGNIPKVVRVQAEANWRLRVLFDDGTEKRYDCRQLVNRPAFGALKNESLFRLVVLIRETMEFSGMPT